jgi:flagellar biosynthesis protein FlhG
LVAFSGGKGGVGATTVALNASVSLVNHGLRVVLIDVDMEKADVAALCNLPERGHVGDILSARRDIHEVLEPGPGGIQIVPGVWAPENEIPFTERSQQRLLKQIHSLGRHADIVLVDTGNGSSETARHLWTAATEVAVVTTPDSVSVMDSYATIKRIIGIGAHPAMIHVVVNHADQQEAIEVFQRIHKSCLRFLGKETGFLGSVPRDDGVLAAAQLAEPLVLAAPESETAKAYQNIAAALVSAGAAARTSTAPAIA